MDSFSHGDDGYKYNSKIVADFSSNVWPLGPHPHVMKTIQDNINAVKHYPEVEALTLSAKIAKANGIKTENVLVTNGANEAIHLVAHLFDKKPSVILSPTYSEYERALICNKNNPNFQFDEPKPDEKTPDGLFWLCNPNNPTGELIQEVLLEKLIEKNPHTTFVVDESYMDFCLKPESIIHLVNEYPNLIVIKSLTKSGAIPGLRLGFVASSKEIIQELRFCQPIWSVNALAIKAGEQMMDYSAIESNLLVDLHREKDRLRFELSNIPGIEVDKTSTLYFLVKLSMASVLVKRTLVEKYGILVRDASNFRGLIGHHIRIATQSAKQNQLLINALREILN